MGVNRDANKPCQCGSGKKFKKCCIGRKPRHSAYTVDFGHPVTIDSIEFGADGKIRLMSQGMVLSPETSSLYKGYSRPKGDKVLVQIDGEYASHRDFLFQDPDITLLKSFDVIFATDTNTRVIEEHRVSANAFALLRPQPPQQDSSGQTVHTGDMKILVRTATLSLTGNPEIAGWIEAIQWIKCHSGYNPQLRIAVIVDSEQGNIPKYNSGELLLADGFEIPSNIRLIYASDAVSDHLPNKMIRFCHKAADEILDQLERDGLPKN